MKLVCISDTHCQLDKINIPDGDVLIHSGDLTFRGTVQEMQKELDILEDKVSKFKEVIFICGNHDWLGERDPTLLKEMCANRNITYLENSGTTIDGINIWGSPITPWFHSWAFNKHRGAAIKKYWDMIPSYTNLLVTHGPPYGILDYVPNGNTSVGCYDLMVKISQLNSLKYHIFGHTHFQGGQVVKHSDMTFINAAVCNEQYRPVNKIVEIEI